jgi:iron(III) transport system ATP-binding protein
MDMAGPGKASVATVSRLALNDVSCVFGLSKAVDRLSLSIEPGEFVSLLGPSGCGKTTTLRMIAGFIEPTGGTITLDGAVIASPTASVSPERRDMSMIFQSYAIWPHMTVAENVGFGLTLRKFNREAIRTKVAAMLDVVQLGHLADRYPAALSGGQQQRVALARAMVIEPRVLLLDEPLSNLDAGLREEMRYEIRRLHDAFKVTTVYVTHDQGEAMVTSDRIAVMYQGRLEQIDTPRVLYSRPRTRFVAGFIGRANFLEGNCVGDDIVFDRFALPLRCFAQEGLSAGDEVTFSVRPHSIGLHPAEDRPDNTALTTGGAVLERAFLGDTWEYVVAPEASAVRLKVTTDPLREFEIGAKVWLEFAPQQMARIT